MRLSDLVLDSDLGTFYAPHPAPLSPGERADQLLSDAESALLNLATGRLPTPVRTRIDTLAERITAIRDELGEVILRGEALLDK